MKPLLDILDLLEHTLPCGIERVRVCANGIAHAHAHLDNRQIVFYGYWDEPPDRCYGIASIGELYSWLTNPKLTLVKQVGNLLTFQNKKTGNNVVYSFISDERIAELVPYKTLKYKIDYNALVTPPDNFLKRLKLQRKITNTKGNNDPSPHLFAQTTYVKDHSVTHVNLQFGDWSTTVEGNIVVPATSKELIAEPEYRMRGWQWDVNDLINILSQTGTFKIGFADGLMAVQCITDVATYHYVLPALVK